MAKAAIAERPEDGAANEDVDNVPEVDDFRTGQVSEGELELARSVAKRMGWTPKEEWKRDPAKWVDAPDFLENTPRELEQAKDKLKRSAQANEAAIEEVRRQERLQALEEIRTNAGDPEKVNAAVERVKAAEGPPPQVQAWVRDNPWFNEDPEAADYATSVSNRLAREGRPVAEQLEAARVAVMKRFPEYSGQARAAEPTETRLSEARRPPVQAGSRGPSSAPKERGWGDLPSTARAAAAAFVKQYQRRGLTEADAQKRYADSYWRDQA
jgi:hypothetical protein